jgi:sugar lactone lactonase YvrE
MFLSNALRRWTMARPISAGKPRGRVQRRTEALVLEVLEDRLCPSGGYLLVSNFGGNDVLRFDETTGAFLGTLVAPGSGGLSTPRGLDFGPDGNLAVLSGPFLPFTAIPSPGGNGQDEVLRFDSSTGEFLGTLVENGDLADARALVFGHDQNLYVSNDANGTDRRGKDIESFDGTTGKFLGHFVTPNSGGLNHPQGLVFGPDGNLYVSDAYSHSIMRYDGVTGAPLPSPGNSGALFVPPGSGGLVEGQGIVFGPDGNLYVADGGTGQVLRYDGVTGAPLPSAGNTGATFIPADSTGDRRAGMIFGPNGDLYLTSSVAGTDLVTVLRFDGTTGAPLPSAGNSGATFIPAGSGGLSGLATYLIFTETDPTTLSYDTATPASASALRASVAQALTSPVQTGSLTTTPNPVTAGSTLTLTASNISDTNPSATSTQVAFSLDSNGDGILDGGDTLLGNASQSSTLTGTFTISTAGITSGTYTLFAQAKDTDGVLGDPIAAPLTVS